MEGLRAHASSESMVPLAYRGMESTVDVSNMMQCRLGEVSRRRGAVNPAARTGMLPSVEA